MVAKRGPLQKFQKEREKEKKNEGLESALVPGGSILLRFLGYLAQVCLDCCVLSSCRDRGAPGAHKELRR